ncbi:MAG: zinc ribbon domain-containing protein [Bdellovibrionota bacterium]|jgi:predicted  nucleic acid-binding Zn-ribbon protein
MNDSTTSPVLTQLIQLSELDSSIARLFARQRQIEEERHSKVDEFQQLQRVHDDQALELQRKRKRYEEEERRIQDENSKLVERRKVLSSFSNYKVQQSAQKEIEASAKQLAAQEEKLIETLEEMETLEAALKTAKEALALAREKQREFMANADEECNAIVERSGEKEAQRADIARRVDPTHLGLYDIIRKRHAVDPLVGIQQGKCGGCYMQVAPQMMVQVARGKDLVKCRGCGRILYLQEEGGRVSG